jgi:heat shock protein HslJ
MKPVVVLAAVLLFSCKSSFRKEVPAPPPAETPPEVIIEKPTDDPTGGREPLHNFWVLERVNDSLLDAAKFPFGTPYIKFDTVQHTITGFAGCNGISGSIKTGNSSITFSTISAGENKCDQIEFEKKYLKSLSGKTVMYELEPGRLKLKGPDRLVYSFRKIQQ